jgi:hypothetical protein
VRRWCEHGYKTAFEKTVNDLLTHFKPEVVPPKDTPPVTPAATAEKHVEASTPAGSAEHTGEGTNAVDAASADKTTTAATATATEEVAPKKEDRVISATVPVTIDDNKEVIPQ